MDKVREKQIIANGDGFLLSRVRVYISIGTFILLFLIQFAYTVLYVTDIKAEVKLNTEIRKDQLTWQERIEYFVTRKEYQEMQKNLQESLQEIKQDLKEVNKLLRSK